MNASDETRELTREIEETRERLGETVQALVAKADVKARAREKADQLRGRAQGKAEDFRGRARAALEDERVRKAALPSVVAGAVLMGAGVLLLIRRRR